MKTFRGELFWKEKFPQYIRKRIGSTSRLQSGATDDFAMPRMEMRGI